MNLRRLKWPITVAPFVLVSYAIYLTGSSMLLFAQSLVLAFALYLPLTISLNIEAGYAGIPNFGKMLYFAGGAAVGGSVATFLWSGWVGAIKLGWSCIPLFCVPSGYETNSLIVTTQQINPVLAASPLDSIGTMLAVLAIGAVVGAGLGYLSSFPAIHLREDYLGMLLLASAQLFVVFDTWYEPLNFGALGVFPVPNVYGWIPGDLRYWAIGGILLAFAVLVYLHAERMARSPLGRKLRAIRESEVASEALGKDTVADRRRVLIYASAITGMVGGFYALELGYVGPGLFSRVLYTLYPWVIIVMGGLGNNFGAIFGTFAFTFTISAVDQLKSNVAPPSIPTFNLLTASPELAAVLIGAYALVDRKGLQRYLGKRRVRVSAKGIGIVGVGLLVLGVGALVGAASIGALAVGYFAIDTSYLEYIAFGSILIVVLLLRPEGVIPEKPTASFRNAKLRGLVERFLAKPDPAGQPADGR